MEAYLKQVQSNQLTAKNSPILFLILTIAQLLFLYAFSTCLDIYYGSGFYFFILALIPTITHAIAWIFAYNFQTGHFFDLNGEISLLITLLWSILSKTELYDLSTRKILINCCVIIWDIRLGTFCFIRMIMRGSDFRFEQIKHAACFYLFAHIAQSVWVFLVCLCLFIFNLKDNEINVSIPLGMIDYIGLLIFMMGFLIEIIADEQKWSFKTNNNTKKKWIDDGLWSYSRHPNYFGECTLWFGICIMCTSQLNINGLSFVFAWISPIWATFFLITTSLAMLERLADQRYGNNKKYKIYKETVPILIPDIG